MVLLEGSPISTVELWSAVRVTIGFLVTSLTKALLSRLLSLAGRPALGRVLVVTNFNAADIFWYPYPDLWAHTILSQSSTDNSFNLVAWFLL